MSRRAIVVGSGVAGPVVAVGLLEAGFEPVVYEARPQAASSAAGSWLTLAVNGLEALRTFDLHRAVVERSFPSTSIELFNGAGRRLGVAPLGGVLADGTVTRTLKRADLCRALEDEAQRRGVRIQHERRLAHAQTLPDGSVLARFEDGTEDRGAVLVGADGVHSRVRALLDPRAPRPRETAMGNVGGFVSGAGGDLAPGTFRMIFGRRAFFGYVVHPSRDVWWFANPPVPYPHEPDAEWLAKLFDGDEGPAAQLVRGTPGPLSFVRQYELPRVPTWQRGSMVLLGDAAHAASPTSGQGASLAAEDAVALARCLRDLPVPEALAAFEGARRARAERVVLEAARMSSNKIPGALGRFARDLVLPMLIARATTAPRDWLFAYRTPWEERATSAPAEGGR